jgi:hypothetical protein
MADNLSKDRCLLLAVDYASESDIASLRSLLAQRQDAFTADLILRILLTYLPESVDPSQYAKFVDEATSSRLAAQEDTTELDLSSIQEIKEKQARKRVKALQFASLNHPACPPTEGFLTKFIISRAHQLDSAGFLLLLPALVDPFLERSDFLRTWFISNVLPLLRFGFEFYPDNDSTPSLNTVENASGERMISIWLLQASTEQPKRERDVRSPLDTEDAPQSVMARDLKGLVGPWIYGDNDRKRRRLSNRERRPSINVESTVNELVRQVTSDRKDPVDEWDHAFSWMVQQAAERLPAVTEAIEAWDGPPDVDLGGYAESTGLTAEGAKQLRIRYAQTALAAVYAATTDTPETISSSHSMLVRIADLMDFKPPPELASSVELLPRIDAQKSTVGDMPSSIFVSDALLRPGHPLTTPRLETFSLLQMFVFSAYMSAGLGFKLSVMHLARLRFQSDAEEQMAILQKILHAVSTGPKRDDHQWAGVLQRLLWLWGWGIMKDSKEEQYGSGVLGKIERFSLEKEMLKLFLIASCYSLVIDVHIKGPEKSRYLSSKDVESIIVEVALQHYDNATNGNRTRGSMKKASEIVLTLRQYFSGSPLFQAMEALLSATHALSFYSLTLQHGVPFRPVNIRVSSDPLSLIEKVLAQNPRSYTHLDDLISIATDLVAAQLVRQAPEADATVIGPPKDLSLSKRTAERRVIDMAIEAALNEDDFETAYSYVVNRLHATSARQPDPQGNNDDDISWRAALAAGRHRSNHVSNLSASTSLGTPPVLRRLEQRMELLSQALLLAPPSALPEVLNVWRKCEEEMTALLARESEEETAFNDRADKGLPGAFVNTTAAVQPRREVGRAAQEEAPMGLFDVARGAAAAFSRNAFPLRAQAQASRSPTSPTHGRNFSSVESEADSIRSEGSEDGNRPGRRRKRDMVAEAVTGGLASGIGWVLGAKPLDQQQR